MNDLDRIFLKVVGSHLSRGTMIVCLFTGLDAPSHCSPMARQPAAATGMAFDIDFPEIFIEATKQNFATHDGAVMVGRPEAVKPYKIIGWSFRLFPDVVPPNAPPNRGSAFNSALAMSCIPTIDLVYWISGTSIYRFCDGKAFEVATGS